MIVAMLLGAAQASAPVPQRLLDCTQINQAVMTSRAEPVPEPKRATDVQLVAHHSLCYGWEIIDMWRSGYGPSAVWRARRKVMNPLGRLTVMTTAADCDDDRCRRLSGDDERAREAGRPIGEAVRASAALEARYNATTHGRGWDGVYDPPFTDQSGRVCYCLEQRWCGGGLGRSQHEATGTLLAPRRLSPPEKVPSVSDPLWDNDTMIALGGAFVSAVCLSPPAIRRQREVVADGEGA